MNNASQRDAKTMRQLDDMQDIQGICVAVLVNTPGHGNTWHDSAQFLGMGPNGISQITLN